MSRMRAISRPVKVTVLAKFCRNVRTPRATKISRSCSVGSPSSLLPCTCQVTRSSLPSGSVLVPLSSIFPICLPTRRSSTANGIAARFSSSTERFRRVGWTLPTKLNRCYILFVHCRCCIAPDFYDQSHERSGIHVHWHLPWLFHSSISIKPFHIGGD